MMKAKVEVRAAVPGDVPTIHDFITQLAVFEKCPERVLATHDTLATTLGLESEPGASDTDISATRLRPGQFAKCVIAHIDGKDVGFSVFFYNYSTVPYPTPVALILFLIKVVIFPRDIFRRYICGTFISIPRGW
jgi:hypothetical protein